MRTRERFFDRRHHLRRRINAIGHDLRRARGDVLRLVTALGLSPPSRDDVIEVAADGARSGSWSAAVRVMQRGAWVGVGVVVVAVALWSVGMVSAALLLVVFVCRLLGLRVDLSRAASSM